MIRFTRTFHPVGQGAFYSERFSFANNLDFLTIYDCGTDLRDSKLGTPTQITGNLESRINQDLGAVNPNTGKHDVQLLFISHFDEDHVSGVHTLNPRTVVIPLASQDEITFYRLLDFLQITNINWNLLQNPKHFFGNNTKIIGIIPDDEENERIVESGNIALNEEGGISGNNQIALNPNYPNVDIVIPSGSPINIKSFWQYIAFNPKISKLAKFKTELANQGWNWDTLADDLKSNLNQDKIQELRKIYKKVSSDLNSTSLLVYSCPTDTIDWDFICQKNGTTSCICCECRLFHEDCYYYNHRIACLYLGDWKVSKRGIQKYYKQIPYHGDGIGTIQIPHHGSIYNNGQYALEYLHRPRHIKCVISCGNHNRFGHPSNLLISEIMKLGGQIRLVTDDPTSAFIACYELGV